MLIVPLEEARPEMILAADVMHPASPEQVLLKGGFELEEMMIRRMQELGVSAIYVNYPELADLDRHLIPGLSPDRLKIFSQIKDTIGAVQKVAKPSVGFQDYYLAIRGFILTLLQQGEHPIYLEQLAGRLGDDAVAHATSVAHLSLLLGITLQGYLRSQRKRLPKEHAVEVVNLGVAGMLHDIGKCKLKAGLEKYSIRKLPAEGEDRTMWEGHPQIGYDMIRGGVESSAAAAVLFHHARFDGQGFPTIRGRDAKPIPAQGTHIHVFARILALADLFDRLTHADGEAKRRPAFEVLHLLRTEYASWVDPVVLKALLKVVPPFAPGCRVGLSDGTDAVVTALGKDVYRPFVRRFAADGWTLLDEAEDLSNGSGLAIRTCDGVIVDIEALTAVGAEAAVGK